MIIFEFVYTLTNSLLFMTMEPQTGRFINDTFPKQRNAISRFCIKIGYDRLATTPEWKETERETDNATKLFYIHEM
jgi:hypothetical protein